MNDFPLLTAFIIKVAQNPVIPGKPTPKPAVKPAAKPAPKKAPSFGVDMSAAGADLMKGFGAAKKK